MKHNSVVRFTFALFILLNSLLFFQPVPQISAQTDSLSWDQPINLSESGAASQPRIVSSPDGELQVFWWDSFDGLLTAIFSGDQWSKPQAAPIHFDALQSSPTIVADASGWIHAFWIDGGPGGDLWHVQMPFGTEKWTAPQRIAVSVLTFETAKSSKGGLDLAYIHTKHDADSPAGIYVMHMERGGQEWLEARAAYSSIYFRLLAIDQSWLDIADGSEGEIFLTFRDPQQGDALFTYSNDRGFTWSTPETIGNSNDGTITPWVSALPNGFVMRLWQTLGQGACTLLQQNRFQVDNQLDPGWTEPGIAVEVNLSCPQANNFWPVGENTFWIWGEGTNNLALFAWDPGRLQWSEPQMLSFSFENTALNRTIELQDLHAAFSGDHLVVAGSDSSLNEVWVTVTRNPALDLVYAQPPPWTPPMRFTQADQGAGLPALAMDLNGRSHLVWSLEPSDGSVGKILLYGYSNGTTISSPSEIMRGGEGEIARQPALIADVDGQLHLVWSGGLSGGVLYSHARAAEAVSPESWSVPKSLSTFGTATWPQIGMDAQGRLYVVYAVPVNENRGIYLVSSQDRGENWSAPIRVFDAVSAGWPMVDYPSLAVAPDGTLHLAWVQVSLFGAKSTNGIFYSRSMDNGETWSEPLKMAGDGDNLPKLALTSSQLHLLYTDQGSGIWHRWIALGQQNSSSQDWSPAARVPGWQGISPPFGLAVDGYTPGEATIVGNRLHLVGASPALDLPVYSTWNNDRWSPIETFTLSAERKDRLGAVAATKATGGSLAVAWLAPSDQVGTQAKDLLFTIRSIPILEVPVVTPIPPTSTPEATSAPTLVPTKVPTPTPNLNRIAPPENDTVSPLALSGGAAALILAGVFFARWIFERTRS